MSEAYALPAAHIVNHENHPGQFILGEDAEECYVGWDLGVMEQPYEQQIVWDEPNAKQGAFLEKFLTSY